MTPMSVVKLRRHCQYKGHIEAKQHVPDSSGVVKGLLSSLRGVAKGYGWERTKQLER